MSQLSRSRRQRFPVPALIAAASLAAGALYCSAADSQSQSTQSTQSATDPSLVTTSPIKHVVIIVGENRTFDHVFGAYKPREGQTVSNLLSKGIIRADGTPGPNFALAAQYMATANNPLRFDLSAGQKKIYPQLPAPNTGSAPQAASDASPGPFATFNAAKAAEGYALLPGDIVHLTTGATGIPKDMPDTRFGSNLYNLKSGPYQISREGPDYDQYMNSPVHRFYQNWQQADCNITHKTAENPSGCKMDLFAWVEVSVGAGSDGAAQPSGFDDETTHEGATALGYYNVNHGDMPYFTELARHYTISDNYHQPVMGGTGANSIMIGTADALYYTDGNGHIATPPKLEIEDPRPQPGTNNYYKQDGYSGGTYSNCSDRAQPGVGPIRHYLDSLPYQPNANCATGTYYLLNNYNPGYFGDGTVNTTDKFTIPPSPVPTIADTLLKSGISWKYYGEGWTTYKAKDPNSVYCNICNPFLYETAIMTNATVRGDHLKDTPDLYSDITNGTLPAVSFVKPGGLLDGHPASSKFGLYEAFVHKIVSSIQANPALWASTAIFITTDEGGGYYDSGYIQPLDFFGDGPRIPLIVVSPYSRGGHVVHDYSDHVSLVKFIERNWSLGTITSRSRDNLPDPTVAPSDPYVPTNAPAIGDLFGAFQFTGVTPAASAGGGTSGAIGMLPF